MVELFALKSLVDKKFDRIRNLKDDSMNETFANIYCEKNDEKYINSVKTRNKFQKNGKLKISYNLGKNVYEKALADEKKYKAKACCLSIQIDQNSIFIYFG